MKLPQQVLFYLNYTNSNIIEPFLKGIKNLEKKVYKILVTSSKIIYLLTS
jgi:hypothetical protein